MKFPTQTPVFPDVTLSESERSRFEQLASALVRDTLADYDVYSDEQQRAVSARRWKAVKSRENVTVYKDRRYDATNNVHRGLASSLIASRRPSTLSSSAASSSSSLHASSSSSTRSSALPASILESLPAEVWTLPQLLMVGTLSGSLDDVMYGIVTPDPGIMLLKTHYTQDEVIDGQVLAQIRGPTPAEPYQFLGLKWVVKGNPAAVSALVMPRDLTILESTGILTHSTTAERIGYFLMHSVRLPSCGTAETRKYAVRGRISTCYIFKELRQGVVDVYMKGFVEASGAIADAVAVVSAANGLLCCWRAVVCAHSRKLVWALRAKRASGPSKRQAARSDASASTHSATSCRMCTKSFKRYSRTASCELCDAVVCSHCRVAMKLAFASRGTKRVRVATVELCKGCVARTSQESTFDVAQREVRSGRFQARPSGDQTPFTSSVSDDIGISISSSSASTTRLSETRSSSTARAILLAHAQDYASSNSSGRADFSASTRGASTMSAASKRTNELNGAAHTAPKAFSRSCSSGIRGRTPEEQHLWTRMVQLQVQAEQLYEFTKRNTDTLMLSSAKTSTASPSMTLRMSID